MLSMNSSVSAPVVSRKYSAIVRAERATRRRAPGGSFIWPNTMQVCSMTLRPVLPIFGFLHFEPQVGPFAGSLADAGKHRVTAVRAGDAGDQLGENDRLAQTGPAEQAGLAAADERREQVDDLDAGFEHFGLGREVGDRRRIAVDRPALLGVDRTAAVDRLAEQIEHAAQRGLADRHGHRAAGVDALPCRGPCRRCCPGRRSARGRRPGAAALRR